MSQRRKAGSSAKSAPTPPPLNTGYVGKMPLFALGINKKGFAVAGGGGGASKTGIPNGLIFFKHNEDRLEKIGEHKTNDDAIMGLDVHPEENTVVFVDQDQLAVLQFAAGGTVLTSRLSPLTPSNDNNNKDNKNKNKSTDSSSGPLARNVKTIRFSPDASKLALGSYDGALSVISYPGLATVAHLDKAHTDDIDDVAWGSAKTLATTSKDKTCQLWSVEAGALRSKHTLVCEAEGQKLQPRGCRFSPIHADRLYVSAFILGKSTYVFVWNTESGSLLKKSKIHNGHATSFAMSAAGTYVAVGDVDGTIVVAQSESLSKVLQVKPHGFVVPALAFTPLSSTTGSATKKREKGKQAAKKGTEDSTALVSVGADYACMYTPIIHQSFVNKKLIVIVLSLIILLVAVLLKMFTEN